MLLSDKTNYTDNIEAVKKYISFLTIELKKRLKRKIFFYREKKYKDGFNMISIL